MIPLIVLKSGESCVVVNFAGDDAEFTRLRSFGLDVNTKVSIVTSQADKKGPVLLLVSGNKYAIDYDLASKVFVKVSSL